MQKTKSLLQPEVLTVGKHLTLSSSSSLLQNYAHPSSKEGTKSFASSSFKETEGVRVKLSLLKMPLVVVSNRESIRRNNRWKRKEKKKERGRTRNRKVSRGCKEIWGGGEGFDRSFSLNFSRGNVIGRRRCAEIERGYKLFKLTRAEKRPVFRTTWVLGGAGFRRAFWDPFNEWISTHWLFS